MFRWLALCVVLCAGAFALVALATGAFLPRKASAEETVSLASDASTTDESVQPAAAGQGVGRGGAIVLSNARLTPIEREDAPSQHDGTILVIGTDEQGDLKPDRELPPTRVSFLVIKVWGKTDTDPTPPAALLSQGIALVPLKGAEAGPKQAVPYTWAVQHPTNPAAPANPPGQADSSTQPPRRKTPCIAAGTRATRSSRTRSRWRSRKRSSTS